jgi:hypothetical protein
MFELRALEYLSAFSLLEKSSFVQHARVRRYSTQFRKDAHMTSSWLIIAG